MNSGIEFLGRVWPTTPSRALRNLKYNMQYGWKVTRLVTSAIMSVTAAGLVSTCSTCANEADVTNNNSTTSVVANTLPDFSFNVLSAAAKVCFIGGCMYGTCSVVKFVVAIVHKGIRPCVELSRANLDENARDIHTNRAVRNMIVGLLPESLAGFMGMDYGRLVVAESIYRSPSWFVANGVIGGLSCGLYLLDTSIALWDMVSLDVEERDRRAAQVRRYLGELFGLRQQQSETEEMSVLQRYFSSMDQMEGYVPIGSWLSSLSHNDEGSSNHASFVFSPGLGDVIRHVWMEDLFPKDEEGDDDVFEDAISVDSVLRGVGE
ncbi:hypothetical protein CLAVI_000591 [Candidatus Clavichlamydia salmonicola]|uniref:hypothetical protein n=1 Tax=Candidatus Clavichlamydia salmonicola TaxID=469812 RepID=UPI0018915D2D|nr:hypothetical protein [Candidatus Clavichlamydia salmonicola]MBF5050968.1 hypothetical protein [Candidatus Clavichlamydia salmonicola]